MFYEVILGRNVGKSASILTYASHSPLKAGTIVEVPIGRATAAGIILKKVEQPDFRTKEIVRVLYSKPLPAHLIETAKWISEYYVTPLSGVIGMILPNGVLKKRRKTGVETPKTEQLALKPEQTEQTEAGGEKPEQWLCGLQIPLNPSQKNALQGLQKAQEATRLLFGVTGSGKTNIYVSEAVNALKRHMSVVLLVPEIALTGQLVRVFSDYFGDRVVLIHSGQTEAERHRIFEKILFSDAPQIVVGPRSALFAPLSNLGLIIIDEEHEPTYYQENAPRYSAVRVASFMAKKVGGVCLLGSATPAVSDYYLAEEKSSLVRLTKKAKDEAIKPEIHLIDLKKRDEFTKNRYFSNKLIGIIKSNLEGGYQTLIFHNRRGSAPLTICEECGEEILCPNCFLPLTLHADTYELVCHTCGYKERVPTLCPKCGHPRLIHKGFGTKLLENELSRLFPKARIRRFDGDNKKGEGLDQVYDEVKNGEVDILIGTQGLAKGLDLPLLASVGIVQADAGLSLPDFAAEERTFQLITQVIGRVGRGHIKKAEVVIQTFRPDHPVLKFATEENYENFAHYLLEKRREGGFPPFTYVAHVNITMKTEVAAVKKIREAKRLLGEIKGLAVSPPMPAFHEHTNQGYTWQIVVRAKSHKTLVSALSKLQGGFRLSLDPPSLL